MSKQAEAYKNNFNRQNYDRLTLMLPKGQKVKLQALAKERGISLNEFYAIALKEYLDKNGIDISGE